MANVGKRHELYGRGEDAHGFAVVVGGFVGNVVITGRVAEAVLTVLRPVVVLAMVVVGKHIGGITSH